MDPARRTLLGMLTPSSNTVLEPVTAAMLAGLPDVTAHFARFRVTEISMRDQALGQFDLEPILAACDLIADARVASIAWNGTSASWLGLDRDRALCAAIEARTGIGATTSVLALAEVFRLAGVTRYGLVTPYLDEIQERILPNLAREGFDCVAERHLRDRGNFSFSEYSEEAIAALVREVARAAAGRGRAVHQHARRAGRGGAGARARHPRARQRRDGSLGQPAPRGRRCAPRPRLGPPLRGDRRLARAQRA